MTFQQIGRLWTLISAVLLYYALNSWIVSQGGNEIFGAKLVISNRIPAAVTAIPICSILLMVTSFIGRRYAFRSGAAFWHERIPVVGFESIDTASTDGKLYQAAMFVMLTIAPAASLIHFWRLFVTATVVTTKNPPQRIGSVWDWSALTSWNDPARICTDFQDGPNAVCAGNASVLPGFEPAMFAVLTFIALVLLIFHLAAIFRK